MTNYSIIKRFSKIVNDDDVVIFLGERISKVAYNFDRPNYFYVTNDSLNFNVVTGLVLDIPNRIFLVCESDTVIKYFNSFVEIRKYFDKELHIFILRDNVVNNTFNSMTHPQGSFFNFGFKSFKVAPYFETINDCAKLKGFMDNMRDTSSFLVNFDNNVFDKYMIDIKDNYSLSNKLIKFMKNQ
jgi:hypothetical protein